MQHTKLKGVGLGLRSCHYSTIENDNPNVPWFEVLTDNYLMEGGPSLAHLESICSGYPTTLHCVGMSLGSTDALNKPYLQKIKNLMLRTNPITISDHLCWTSFENANFHELLPLPYTQEAIMHTAARIREVQDFLGQQILIENVSSYLSFTHSTYTEWDFLQHVSDEANCLILLDINNIYVSAHNNGFLPEDYINGLTTNRVAQFHLGGFLEMEDYLLDNHGTNIHPNVWKLYINAVEKFGACATVIEWDTDIPAFSELLAESGRAKKILDSYALTA